MTQASSNNGKKQNEVIRAQRTINIRKDLNRDQISKFSKDFVFSNLKKRVIRAQEKIPHPSETMYFEKYLNNLFTHKSAVNSIMIESETPEKIKNALRENKKYSVMMDNFNQYHDRCIFFIR